MSDRKNAVSDSQKRHKKVKQTELTSEQIAAAKEARAKAEAEAKAEQERIQALEKALPEMSDRQVRGLLRTTIKKEYAGKPPQPQAGLNILYATVLLTVLENTKTKENPWAKLSSYVR